VIKTDFSVPSGLAVTFVAPFTRLTGMDIVCPVTADALCRQAFFTGITPMA
jgi:hypothetical protein